DIPSASATFRIERPWLNNTLICSCIRAVFLSLAMAGTSAMPSRSCARRRSPLPGNLTTLQMVVNSADHLWSTSRANGWSTSLIRGGQLRCKRVVNSKCNRTDVEFLDGVPIALHDHDQAFKCTPETVRRGHLSRTQPGSN